jgi:hypothetical protein
MGTFTNQATKETKTQEKERLTLRVGHYNFLPCPHTCLISPLFLVLLSLKVPYFYVQIFKKKKQKKTKKKKKKKKQPKDY